MNVHAIVVIIILALILFTGAYFLFHFFYERDHFLLVARTPQLATLSAASSLSVVLAILVQDFLNASDLGFPCVVDLVFSYLYPPLYASPYLLRGWRLMVIYVPVLRRRYTNTTRQATLYRIVLLFLGAHIIIILLLASLIPHYRLLESGCHMYDEWYVGLPLWAFYIGLLVYIVNFLSSRGILTVYNITGELKIVCITWATTMAFYFVLRIAAWSNPHFDTSLNSFEKTYIHTQHIILIANLISFYISIVHPIRGLFRGDAKKYEEQLKTVSKSRTQSFMEEDRAAHHLIQDILHNEESCKLFKKHAEKFLCVENVMFWQEVDNYMNNFTTVPTHRNEEVRASNPSCAQALRIYTRFIRPNCIFQVNIPYSHQKDLIDLFEPKTSESSGTSGNRSAQSSTRDLTENDVILPINDRQMIIKQGTLRKLGGFRHNWKERYFVLTDDDNLSYYKSQSAFQMGDDALGTIYLLGAAIRVFSDVTYKKGNTFGVHPANEERTYVCSAPTNEERQSWLSALRKENPTERSPLTDVKNSPPSAIVKSPSDIPPAMPSPPSSTQSELTPLHSPEPVEFKSEKEEPGKMTIQPLIMSDNPMDQPSPQPLLTLPSQVEEKEDMIPGPPPNRDRHSTVISPPLTPPPLDPSSDPIPLPPSQSMREHAESVNLPISISTLEAKNPRTFDMEMVINPVHSQRDNRSESHVERYPFAKKLTKETFNEAQNDIEKLLMFNVMKSFKTSPEFLQFKESLKESSQVLDALQLMGSRRSSSKLRAQQTLSSSKFTDIIGSSRSSKMIGLNGSMSHGIPEGDEGEEDEEGGGLGGGGSERKMAFGATENGAPSPKNRGPEMNPA